MKQELCLLREQNQALQDKVAHKPLPRIKYLSSWSQETLESLTIYASFN